MVRKKKEKRRIRRTERKKGKQIDDREGTTRKKYKRKI